MILVYIVFLTCVKSCFSNTYDPSLLITSRFSCIQSLLLNLYRLSLRNFPNPEDNFAQHVFLFSCFLHIVSILYIDLGICQEQLYLWLDPPINIPHTDFSTSLGKILGNELLLIKYTAVSSLSPNFHLNWAVLL